jgi:zinc protease
MEGAPVVAVRIWLPGGSRVETIPGQALISGRMLAEGSRHRDWQRISREAEARGCSIVTEGGHSVQTVAIDGLAGDWERMLEWAVELTHEATFPDDRCEWLRQQALAELHSLADLPEVVTGWAFLEQLYGDHPLGRPLQGTMDGLRSLDGRKCSTFHRLCLARGALVAVAGEIDVEAVSARLGDLLDRGSESRVAPQELVEPGPPAESRRRVALAPGDQAHLYIGGLTVKRGDSDFEAVQLLGVVLGSRSGLVGRLPQRIREEEGLAYGCDVASVAGAGVDRGRLVVSLGTSVSEADRAVSIVRQELERVRSEGPAEDEIEMARSFLIGREPFRRETARQWCSLELQSMLWNVPVSDPVWTRKRLAAVRPDAVRRAAEEYLEPTRLVETIGLPK